MKAAEKAGKPDKGQEGAGLLATVPRALPALVEAQQIASRAAGVGFDWENPEQVLDKLHEELAEFAEARRRASQAELEDELGDLLFVLVNLARFVKVDPEAGAAQDQREVSPALRLHRTKVGGTRQQTGGIQHSGNGGAMAGSEAVIEIRQLSQLDEFAEVLRLQQVIWGFADVELLPLRFLVVVSKVGGHVFGALWIWRSPRPRWRRRFRLRSRILAQLFRHHSLPWSGSVSRSQASSRPGVRICTAICWACCPHITTPESGGRLLRQREEALSRGIELIEWTFDPLELKNAYLNIQRLGVIVRRYSENQYGVTHSPLHGGLPTDRCIAEWWLACSPRVRATLAEEKVEHHPVDRIAYPADIARIRSQEPQRAREIQETNAERFLDAFGRGLAVTGFERSETEGTYLLEPWQ